MAPEETDQERLTCAFPGEAARPEGAGGTVTLPPLLPGVLVLEAQPVSKITDRTSDAGNRVRRARVSICSPGGKDRFGKLGLRKRLGDGPKRDKLANGTVFGGDRQDGRRFHLNLASYYSVQHRSFQGVLPCKRTSGNLGMQVLVLLYLGGRSPLGFLFNRNRKLAAVRKLCAAGWRRLGGEEITCEVRQVQ